MLKNKILQIENKELISLTNYTVLHISLNAFETLYVFKRNLVCKFQMV